MPKNLCVLNLDGSSFVMFFENFELTSVRKFLS